MEGSLIYAPPRVATWDWQIAADLYLGGMGIGALFVAVLEDLYRANRHPALTLLAAAIAPMCLLAGISLMVAELGHPARLWYVVTGFNATSPLSWGALCQALLIVAAIAYAWMLRRPEIGTRHRRWLALAIVPLGLIVGAYHGLLLGVLRARPLWHSGPAVIATILALLTAGVALVQLLLCMHRRRRELLAPMRDVRALLGSLLALQILVCGVWWVSLYWGMEPAKRALLAANEVASLMFWAGGIGLGLVLPLGLGGLELWWERRQDDVPIALVPVFAISAMILVGGFFLRYAIVLGGQV